jgi:hypothetical protein
MLKLAILKEQDGNKREAEKIISNLHINQHTPIYAKLKYCSIEN